MRSEGCLAHALNEQAALARPTPVFQTGTVLLDKRFLNNTQLHMYSRN